MTTRSRFLSIILIAALLLVPLSALGDDPAHGDDEQSYSVSERELLEAASSITEQVAEIRGLPMQSPIPKGVKDRDQLREMLVERFHDEISEEEFEAEAQVYRRLGLIDEDLDYREMMLDLLSEQIAGFYDQEAGELYIMAGLPTQLQRPTMAHELFHAIQDQHFDIEYLLEPFASQDRSDYSLARMALIEGDATVLMFDYTFYEQGLLPQNRARSFVDIPRMAAFVLELDPMDMAPAEQLGDSDALDLGDDAPSLSDSRLADAPPIIRDPLLFPYHEGMQFVVRARSGRTWDEFNEIYDQAPVSTSQILDPELYFDGIEPIDVQFDATDGLPDDYRLAYDNVFGELMIRSWLRTHLEESQPQLAEEAASGWRGDRIRGYESPDGDMLVTHLSTWDSVDDAEEFARALEEIAALRYDTPPSHSLGTHGESWCIRPGSDDRGERLYIERWGPMVLYIEGTPSLLGDDGAETDPTTYLVRDTVWDSHLRLPFEEIFHEAMEDVENRAETDAEALAPGIGSAVPFATFR